MINYSFTDAEISFGRVDRKNNFRATIVFVNTSCSDVKGETKCSFGFQRPVSFKDRLDLSGI